MGAAADKLQDVRFVYCHKNPLDQKPEKISSLYIYVSQIKT